MHIPDLCFALYDLTLAVAIFGICTLYKLSVNTCSVELLLTQLLWILYSNKKWRIAASISVGLPKNCRLVRVFFFENDKWWVQYPVIYAVLSRLNRCNSFSRYCAIVVEKREKKERSQKIDDLPVLATCRSGTLAILSSKINSPVAHGSTQ